MEVDESILDEKQLDELYLRVYCGLLLDKQEEKNSRTKYGK